ncbi:hypothetical protein SteCoe_2290 [Stentor coeruleus]|uniref:Uncharacterized protein n=1 Tax=Stentor coeruleus TaxID=5963 RepID=A0A1R2CZU4_9CILI|nr:hypothetical protein SteCoe_2290 [Stentor coeruleus]
MKGKLYCPTTETTNFASIRKSHSYAYSKNYPMTPIEFIWPSSIPESWKRIMKKRNISNVQIHKSNRSTLDFLQETQKYIRTICKPVNNEIQIAPKKIETSDMENKSSRVYSQMSSPFENTHEDEKIGYMRKRRRIIKSYSKGSNNGIISNGSLKEFKISVKPLLGFRPFGK